MERGASEVKGGRWGPAAIATLYVVLSAVWIALSDRVLAWGMPGAAPFTTLQTLKGWFFVLGTGLMLFTLMMRRERAVNAANRAARLLEARTAEKEREQANLFASILESMAEAVVVVTSDGEIPVFNAAAERLLGPRMSLPKLQSSVERVPERERSELPLSRALRGEATTNQELFIRSIPHPEGRWIRVNGRPLRGPDGGLCGAVLVGHDITEARRAEDARRASEALFQTLATSSPVGIFRTNLDGNCTYANQRLGQMHARPAGELLGTGWRADIHPDDAARVFAVWEACDQGLPGAFEHRLLRRDGSVVWVLCQAVLERDAAGNVIGALGTVTDITARVEAEAEVRRLNADLERRVGERTAQLEASNAELAAFSYTVSHDLRAPLRVIDGFSLAVLEEDGAGLSAEARSNIERVRAAAGRMTELIDGLLQLGRVTRVALRDEPVDLSALARAVLEGLASSEPGRKVRVDVQPGLRTHGDPGLLRVLLENLLGNAWKFTGYKPEASIWFGYEEREGKGTYTVRDNGAGFDMRYIGKLFGAFERLHTTREFPGTGVGLATVKRIVMRHGGRIWAEGEVGRGAVFSFTLHEMQAAEAPARVPEEVG